MKSVKVVIAVVLIVAILASVMAISGTAQALLDKLTGISSGSGSTSDETSGDSGANDDDSGATDEDNGNSDGSSGGSDENTSGETDDTENDSTETVPEISLVWSEDFSEIEITNSTDEDGNYMYTTDNYMVFYDDRASDGNFIVQDDGDGNKYLMVFVNALSDSEVKPRLNCAIDFTEIFNREKLSLTENKFFALKFNFGSMTAESPNDVYFRYRLMREDGVDTSVVSNSLSFTADKFQEKYPAISNYVGNTLVAFINVSETISESDLYFYIDSINQFIVFEDFLKSDSKYIGSFEILFSNPEKVSYYSFDNFELYTFSKGYEGTVADALKEINFTN